MVPRELSVPRTGQQLPGDSVSPVPQWVYRDGNPSTTREAAMIATRFTKLVGCTVPIQQAGMGAASPPELAADSSQLGAHALDPQAGMTTSEIAKIFQPSAVLVKA
jgi:hypothetical protein